MKADDTTGHAGTPLNQVNTGKTTLKVTAAITSGAVVSLGFLVFALGIRPDLQDDVIMLFVLAKLSFSLVVVATSSVFLGWFSRPGLELRSTLALTAIPFLGVMVLAVAGMAADPEWEQMISGDQWQSCALAVPIITLVPFVAIMWAARLATPVDLARTGVVVGLAASAVSVTAFALHCPIDPAPLVALWFGGTGILCMFSGAKLGPRLLRR